jgi:pimeloyl-ACP methyl ester carboxylesterase
VNLDHWPQVPEAAQQDLRERLSRTRWPLPWPGGGADDWSAGTPDAVLRRLVDRWATVYDWRRHEADIRALPWRRATIGGLPIRFLVFEGDAPDPAPLLLVNGWPSSVLEFVPLAQRLARPTAYGSPASAFTVVVPALPGFPGTPQAMAMPPAMTTHELWHRLMRDELGFEHYGAHGGDLGAGIVSRLAEAHPEAVLGLHLLSIAEPQNVDPASVTDEERAYLDEVAAWYRQDGAYEHQQQTKPLTVSYGLTDSPVGLLAWILEKYHDWTDVRAGEASRMGEDQILTLASLYWFTNSIGTSFRPYWEYAAGHVPPLRRVQVPTALALFPADLSHPPRSWAERVYDIVRYRRFTEGGHFAAWEVPDVLADDVRAFFSPLWAAPRFPDC